MLIFGNIDKGRLEVVLNNGDIDGQIKMSRDIIEFLMKDNIFSNQDTFQGLTSLKDLLEQMSKVRELREEDTSFYGETHINFFTDSDGRDLCIDCAIIELFVGDVERFKRVDNGTDTTFLDAFGRSYGIEHEGSIQYESFPNEYLKDGVTCCRCGVEIVEPQEEEEEDEEYVEEEDDLPF